LRVFAGITIVTGNLGGLAGADNRCQTEADNAGLGGTFKAWLSDETSSPSTRFSRGDGAYRLVDGTVVANSWDDLTDGTLQHGITMTANGETPDFFAEVWTGTATDGLPSGSDWCQNWTSGSNVRSALKGSHGATDGRWTSASISTCQLPARLLCFEQAPVD
jgi:hypothetical protein